jgi:Protein phosphatase 2C
MAKKFPLPRSPSFPPIVSMPREKSRIEHAGMTAIKVPLNDPDSVVFRIQQRPDSTDSMAVSRSFGDVEYKENKRLEEYEQAVVSVPDFVMHDRNDEHRYNRCREKCGLYVGTCFECLELLQRRLRRGGIWDVVSNVQVAEFVLQEM